MRTRYYFHGDLRDQEKDYYCSFCDMFIKEFIEHINNPNHGSKFESNYARFMEYRKRQKKKILNNYYFRPLSADETNLVA